MFSKAKDKMIATAAKRFLEGKLGRYGEIVSFAIESKENSVFLDFLPTGEDKSVQINIVKYRVLEADEGIVIRIEETKADREWVANLLEDYVDGLEIPLGGAAGKLVDWLL